MHRSCGSIDDVNSANCLVCLVSRRAGADVTSLGILKFIVSFVAVGPWRHCGNDVFPYLQVGLQILWMMSISVAGCERSFSKMKQYDVSQINNDGK